MAVCWIACAGAGLCLVLITVLVFVGRHREAKVQAQIYALEAKIMAADPRQVIEPELPPLDHSRSKILAAVRPAEAELLSKVSAATRN